VTTALYGGVFDPPHNGHVALADAALDHFGPERLVVLVAVSPGHRAVHLDPGKRLELATLALGSLPKTEVVPDTHSRTVDLLREQWFDDPLFLIGADEFAAFATWKDPGEVLELARLGVATRPGYAPEALHTALDGLERPDRVEFFEIPGVDVSSSEIRRRVQAGESIDGLVPDAVAREIHGVGLYRCYPGSD
jgi:nicotinate-nucleotide adenylyltransferase